MAWLPVRDAWAGRPSVPLIAKGVIVGATGLIAGLLLLVFGPLVSPILNPGPDESKFAAYTFSALIVAAGFSAYLALKWFLSSLGYLFP